MQSTASLKASVHQYKLGNSYNLSSTAGAMGNIFGVNLLIGHAWHTICSHLFRTLHCTEMCHE